MASLVRFMAFWPAVRWRAALWERVRDQLYVVSNCAGARPGRRRGQMRAAVNFHNRCVVRWKRERL